MGRDRMTAPHSARPFPSGAHAVVLNGDMLIKVLQFSNHVHRSTTDISYGFANCDDALLKFLHNITTVYFPLHRPNIELHFTEFHKNKTTLLIL